MSLPRRRPVRDILLACLVVLLLSQGLIGLLSMSALQRQINDNTASRIALLAESTASQINTGMSMGKPLAQYFGLERILAQISGQMPDLLGAGVVLVNGQILSALGETPDISGLLAAMNNPGQDHQDVRTLGHGVYSSTTENITVAVPLADKDKLIGAVFLSVHPQTLQQDSLLSNNIKALAAITAGAALLLALLFRLLVPRHQLAVAGKLRILLPLVILLLAQILYTAHTVYSFRAGWLHLTLANTRMLAHGLQQDLNRVLSYGIRPDQLRDVEQPMARLMASFPFISEIRLLDPGGRVIKRANAAGALDPADAPPLADTDTLDLDLHADPEQKPSASLQIILDTSQIAAGVRARILDAATVAAAAIVVAIELLMLLGLLMDRAFAPRKISPGQACTMPDDPSRTGMVARPVMFGFLLAMAMPLSFLPLHARSLISPGTGGQSVALLMALPIAAEMACGLLTALLTGRIADRHNWSRPVLAGLVLAMAGNLACGMAASLESFILARGIVGLGYGLSWMGIQSFVVARSPVAYLGTSMSQLIAGLFAGHLAGAAVGAMLMQQLDASVVFYIGAFMLLLPLAGVFKLLWPYRHMPQENGGISNSLRPDGDLPASSRAATGSRPATRSLLFSRDYGLLLLTSIIPFSIAQVGLLSYALPLYLEAHGSDTATVGRILMLYGAFMIYIGPFAGRMADRSRQKKYWIVAGGLTGSLGLAGMYFIGGVSAAIMAVLLLALGSCLAGGAQTAYMLSLDHVRAYGAGAATSIMRAADKFGQMLGPLALGSLFTSAGITAGLAGTGAFYLFATCVFMVFAPARNRTDA